MHIKSFLFSIFILAIFFSFQPSVAHGAGFWDSLRDRLGGSENTQNDVESFPNGGGFGSINDADSQGNGTQSGMSFNNGSSCKAIQDFPGAIRCVTGMINMTIPLVIGIAVFLFLWGLIKYITAGGDDKAVAEARKFMTFGIIALFVMVSVWGLVGILVNTFFSGGVVVPQLK